MPKKATTARSRAQRNKPKAQKSFELVRPESIITEAEENSTREAAESIITEENSVRESKASTAITRQEKSKTSGRAATAVSSQKESKTSERATTAASIQEEQETKTPEQQNTPAPGSASARLAARRQASQRTQQRSVPTLITSEHFTYVRKDLIRIAIFAVVMFTAIIVLYLTLGHA